MPLSQESIITLTPNVSLLKNLTNILILSKVNDDGTTFLYLIDSANDDTMAEQVWTLLNTVYKNPVLKAIIITHSHADHCGGNKWFIENTGCEIWAPAIEAYFLEYPELETALMWGACPFKDIQGKYFNAPAHKADRIIANGETFMALDISVTALPLEGHYVNQFSYIVEDCGKSVFFLADGISGRNVLRKYWIQYLYNEELFKNSLMRIGSVKADYYIPGHGDLVNDIEGLSELNLLAVIETEQLIIRLLKEPCTTEQLLKKVADTNGIRLGIVQNVLIGSTLKSYLSCLYNTGRIKPFVKDNMMYWQTV